MDGWLAPPTEHIVIRYRIATDAIVGFMRSLDAGQAVLDTERAALVALTHEVIPPEAERSLAGTAR
jgi:hypothetical protein